jgi:hypothetical protein
MNFRGEWRGRGGVPTDNVVGIERDEAGRNLVEELLHLSLLPLLRRLVRVGLKPTSQRKEEKKKKHESDIKNHKV